MNTEEYKEVPKAVINEAARAVIDAVQEDETNAIAEALAETHDRHEIPETPKEELPEFKFVDEWTLILIGQLGVTEQNFPTNEFHHPERIFWKAEQLPTTPKGTVNDVYYLYHLNKEKRIAVYLKHP